MVDSELLKLLDERAGLAVAVAEAKKAAGDGGKFGLRSAREAQVLRHLLAQPREAATPQLIVRIWREIIGDSLSRQGPFHLAVWGGKQEARTVELARLRFGVAPAMALVEKPEQALAAAKTPGGVAVLALAGGHGWWGRMLTMPTLRAFAALPDLNAWGPTGAIAIAEVKVGDASTAYQVTLFVKLCLVAVSGVAAFLHTQARTKVGLAVWGAVGGLATVLALFAGVWLHTGS